MESTITTLESEAFPPLLKEIPDPPKQLYCRGALPDPSLQLLAVVGSRSYSDYGKAVVEKLISGLRGYSIGIISGLAIGMDSLAHTAALDAHLYTLAVPGSGLDDSVLYPRRNRVLAQRILESGGGLLSEFEPTFHATKWSFPQRNRIMAGMTHATLVIEAGEKSGTLITSRLATDYNRDVLTVPGSIFSQNTAGPHMLIKLGATPATSSEDILEALHIEVADEQTSASLPENLSPEEARILELLSAPRDRDELIRLLNISTHEASTLLMKMEIYGLITDQNGIYMRT